jgi:hypothetical protein
MSAERVKLNMRRRFFDNLSERVLAIELLGSEELKIAAWNKLAMDILQQIPIDDRRVFLLTEKECFEVRTAVLVNAKSYMDHGLEKDANRIHDFADRFRPM